MWNIKKMIIGLIDVDGHNFPNLPLMKISAWHKQQGDIVMWYNPLLHNNLVHQPLDVVYMSKIFTFTPDYEYDVNAKIIKKGGTGYYYPDGGAPLPNEIEHIYPDYDLYAATTKNTAYGFLSRGCPRQCNFCVVGEKEGTTTEKVANLEEFWHGQKEIKLLDPNIVAAKECNELLEQLIDSKSYVDFTQGLDIRLMTDKRADLLKKIKVKRIHFAWDRWEEKQIIIPKLKKFKEITSWNKEKMGVYVLTNFDTTIEQDLDRVYTLRNLGYSPYVMIYDKNKLSNGHILLKLQRWVNCRRIFNTIDKFEDYRG